MEINQIVAQTELCFIGGKPSVKEFWNNSHTKKIDILKSVDTPQKGIQSCATIGLNAVDIGLISNGKSLRVELVSASDILIDKLENIVATVAFDVIKSQKCFPGYIVKNVIELYIPHCEMKHILLTDPFLWEESESIVVQNISIAWLMIVPISDNEYEYACRNGIDALELVFEKEDIDIYNLYRKSVI